MAALHKLYTIDRKGTLTKGHLINLLQPDYSQLTIAGIALTPGMQNTGFLNGVSMHGQRYLINWSMKPQHMVCNDGVRRSMIYSEPAIEALFEQVRCYEFPNRPSRFQAIFGCEDLANLHKFVDKHPPGGAIFELYAEGYAVVDMEFVTTGHTISETLHYARRYWNGDHSTDPVWECLIELPVTVGNQLGRYP